MERPDTAGDLSKALQRCILSTQKSRLAQEYIIPHLEAVKDKSETANRHKTSSKFWKFIKWNSAKYGLQGRLFFSLLHSRIHTQKRTHIGVCVIHHHFPSSNTFPHLPDGVVLVKRWLQTRARLFCYTQMLTDIPWIHWCMCFFYVCVYVAVAFDEFQRFSL